MAPDQQYLFEINKFAMVRADFENESVKYVVKRKE